MIRIGQKLFQERAILINQQLALAKNLNKCFNMNSVPKEVRNYDQLYNYQAKINSIEKHLGKLIHEFQIKKL